MKCPHCLHLFHDQLDLTKIGEGPEGLWYSLHQTCPGCHKSIIFLQTKNKYQQELSSFLAYPKGSLRSPLPPEVDDLQVQSDYTESSLVLNDSAKASAA